MKPFIRVALGFGLIVLRPAVPLWQLELSAPWEIIALGVTYVPRTGNEMPDSSIEPETLFIPTGAPPGEQCRWEDSNVSPPD